MSAGKVVGLVMMAIGGGLPVLFYIGPRVYMVLYPPGGGPPDQGFMILVYLLLMGSFGAGILLIVVGAMVFTWSHFHPPKRLAKSPD